MKNLSVVVALSSMVLFSCGGSSGDSDTSTAKKGLSANLANTSWQSTCSPYNKVSGDEFTDAWNVEIKLSIDVSLKATYRTEFFRPDDANCDSVVFDALDVSTFDIKGTITTEESIKANGLNETFTYNSDNRDLPISYTLVYINSEKLYFGQKSGDNLGDTPETRHSSISLDNYFTQVIN